MQAETHSEQAPEGGNRMRESGSRELEIGIRNSEDARLRVALLTGGDDRPYALGITDALVQQGIAVDFIGSDALDAPELHASPYVRFLNLRRDQDRNATFHRKVVRILKYYGRLVRYAAMARPRVFHILWNSKFETVDRVLLMLYYRALGKRVVLTAHNVNAAKRDGRDSWFNRLTLGIQYRLCHHVFVHTHRMKMDLEIDFRQPAAKISVIPFGINNTTPRTGLTRENARMQLGIEHGEQTLLFFGQIAPYKGLEYLVEAMKALRQRGDRVRLLIAGKVKPGNEAYWRRIEETITGEGLNEVVDRKVRFIPDTEVECLMQAADVVALPYVSIFQSGVPFLAYSFGLPVIATDVGSLRDDILEGKTGFVVPARDPNKFADAICRFFKSPMYVQQVDTNAFIKAYVNERHSWEISGRITAEIYGRLLSRREKYR
jgi:D-inositol-3-phosphate glycosyltransferase